MWLRKGDPVIWSQPFGLVDKMEMSDDRTLLTADFRMDREFLWAGLFYLVKGMRIGGTRRAKIAPHLTPGPSAVLNVPPNAILIVEIRVLGLTAVCTRVDWPLLSWPASPKIAQHAATRWGRASAPVTNLLPATANSLSSILRNGGWGPSVVATGTQARSYERSALFPQCRR